MATNWTDRVPTYPNRYKVTKADGSVEYITLERADEPTVEGTPINAENLNALEQAVVEAKNATDEKRPVSAYANGTSMSINELNTEGSWRIYIDANSADAAYLGWNGHAIVETFNVRSIVIQRITRIVSGMAWYRITDYGVTTLSHDMTLYKIAPAVIGAMPSAGGTFTGDAIAYETARTTRSLFNNETRASSTTGTLQSVKYFIDVT